MFSLQNRTRVQVWLYENINTRIEGHIVGFDEYMNLVLDDAAEVIFFLACKFKPVLSYKLYKLWISLTFTEPNNFPFSHIESSSDANYHLRKLQAWVFLDNKMVKFSHYPALCSCSMCARKVWSSLKCKISG